MHFVHECVDCGATQQVEAGSRPVHECAMPEHLRGRVARAWVEGYEFGCKEEPADVV